MFALGLLALAPAAHAAEVRTVQVHFAHGTTGATLSGHVEGREAVHYVLGLRAGQMLRVVLASDSHAVAFNVFEPGHLPGRDGALYVGELNGPQMEVRTLHNGNYLIQVFLNRAAARRGERASYHLEVSADGGTTAAPSRSHAAPQRRVDSQSVDARVPGTAFHATGTLPCARDRGQPMRECRFGVRREGNGNGAITVFWPDGGNRVIFFEDNTPVRYDESQADGGARMTVGGDDGLYHVRIGNQRFEIIEAIMAGG